MCGDLTDYLYPVRHTTFPNYPTGEEEDDILEDHIEDQEEKTPEDAVNILIQKEEVLHLLESLSERERHVISMRFGLENGRIHTQEEVGRELNVVFDKIQGRSWTATLFHHHC